MKVKAMIVCILVAAAALIGRAEEKDLSENLFPPELIMEHQQELKLTEVQMNFFKAEVRKTQLLLTEMQWKLEDEVEKVGGMLKPDRIDEQAVTAQLDKVLGLEHDIKRTQMALLIRLKNNLTPEQQKLLRELRNKPPAK